ncbi:MAG: hypothetical protein GOU98_00620 [Candidatus Altiarchaeota archaeon]|nr:hypothetical protein [Candidatus Altiarchaeota archaeon]
MSRKLLLIFMISSVLSSGFSEVIFPDDNKTIIATSFLPSALGELELQEKFVLFDELGIPYGFIENGTFKDSITYGNLTLIPGNDGLVIGSSQMELAAKEMALLRIEGGMNFDDEILRDEDFLKYAYYSQRYGSLENYLEDGLGLDSASEAIDFLDNLDPNLANEFLNMYDAIDMGEVGYSHYDEILDALNKINDEDLSKYLDQETLDEIQSKLGEINEDITRKALDQIKNNIGKEEMELLYKLLKELDYDAIYKIARDYMRELARDGTLDKMGDAIKESNIGDEVKSEFGKAAKEMITKTMWDYMPKDIGYYLIGAGAIFLALTLRRVGG